MSVIGKGMLIIVVYCILHEYVCCGKINVH